MKFPVIVQLIKNSSLWEPVSGQNFWRAGDVSEPLYENTDFSVIKKLIKRGYLKVVSGSLEDDTDKDSVSKPSKEVVAEAPKKVVEEVAIAEEVAEKPVVEEVVKEVKVKKATKSKGAKKSTKSKK